MDKEQVKETLRKSFEQNKKMETLIYLASENVPLDLINECEKELLEEGYQVS